MSLSRMRKTNPFAGFNFRVLQPPTKNTSKFSTRTVVPCLTYFPMYTYSSSHFGMMMSYNVTGGGPLEAPIVELSVPALKLIQSHLV